MEPLSSAPPLPPFERPPAPPERPLPDCGSRAEMDDLGEEIAELSAHIQAATYRLLVMIREFDARHGWHLQGARSCAHWLNWRIGLHLGAAREKVRVARALEHLPKISEAMRLGELSYSKVRAMTRVATPGNEFNLLEVARAGTASHVERIVRAWRRVDRIAEGCEAAKQRERRHFRAYTDEDGMLVLRGRLAPEVGAMLMRALEVAGDELFQEHRAGKRPPDDEPTIGQRRADALGRVAERALAVAVAVADEGTAKSPRGNSADRFQVVVHVDAEALEAESEIGQAVLESGVRVSAETSRRLGCDASRVVMRHDADGQVLDVGRKTRTVPPSIRRALNFRDQGCRFPGCGVRVCDAHHVEHWADGGKTSLDNLVLLCRRHHTAVHEEGFRVELSPGGRPTFHYPWGSPVPEAPPAPRLGLDPVERLRRQHEREGIWIGPITNRPTWDGSRLDLGMAVQGLRAISAATAAREQQTPN